MGSLVGSIFDLAEGNPTGKEQNELGALGGYETGVGEGLTTAGAGEEEAILSGDPTRIATALAPEISSGQTQVQQQAEENAQLGNRAGGTNASTQDASAANRANIINLEGGLQSGAASTALNSGGNLLSQASPNIQSEAEMAAANQKRMTTDVGGIATGAAQIAGAFADPAAAAAPTPTLDTTGGADPLGLNAPPGPNMQDFSSWANENSENPLSILDSMQ